MKELISKYELLRSKQIAYNYVFYVIGWDSETVAPKGCFKQRAKQIGVLSEESYKLTTSDEYVDVVNKLYDNLSELDELLAFEIIKTKEMMDKIKKIPMNEYIEHQVVLANSQNTWAQAKNKNDFKMFLPTLDKIFDYNKKISKYLETDELKGYDVLLNEYEKGFKMVDYDKFFNLLKERLVPFIKKVTSKKLKYNEDFEKYQYPVYKQEKIVGYLADVMCYDKNRGVIMESEHPFTSGFGCDDVRITVHYYENLFTSSIFSAIHELGHATYELNVDHKLEGTLIGGGASMALHESQSRFYENIIGRSKEFWEVHYNELLDTYQEQLKSTSLEDFFKYINKVENSYIRTEADELTYSVHIMLRYELEKAIFNDQIKVCDLEKKWNELFKEYFGLDVPKPSLGVLQDIHWAGDSIGYFPSYALGSAYAAQIYHAMNQDFNVLDSLKSGNTKKINDWLKDKIHKYGSSKYSKDILKMATNEEFNPNYYIEYLINKYSKIYNL